MFIINIGCKPSHYVINIPLSSYNEGILPLDSLFFYSDSLLQRTNTFGRVEILERRLQKDSNKIVIIYKVMEPNGWIDDAYKIEYDSLKRQVYRPKIIHIRM